METEVSQSFSCAGSQGGLGQERCLSVYKKKDFCENKLLKYNDMTFVSLVMQLPWDLSSW